MISQYLGTHPHRIAVIVVLFILVFGSCAPLFADRPLRAIERFGARLARRKTLAVFSIVTATILIRLSLLPVLPVPVPAVGDEFSYLLAADTFAHGRLTNPPHPMWIYFDTFNVNQLPTYMSKYPPAQGAVLALGQFLGNPWIGVLLSASVMCGAMLWMLQGWLPPHWALLGASLLMIRIGIFNYWMNSYWGGAVAAIGGALVVGALPRIVRFYRMRDAVTLGIGAAILANSRPFEGLLLCLPVFAALAIWLCRRGSSLPPGAFARMALPFAGIVLACGAFMGYYNWRGTGHVFLSPYIVNDRTYFSTPPFAFEQLGPPRHYVNLQFDEFYNGFSRAWWASGHAHSVPGLVRVLWGNAETFAGMFLLPELCVPLLAVPWVLMDRRVRFLVAQFAFCFAGTLLVVWFQPHYAAPLTATTLALVVQGMRHLRRWRLSGRPVGIGISRAIVLCAVVLTPFRPLVEQGDPSMKNRARIATELRAMPGNHLVVVRYSPTHGLGSEWVYNAADIDRAKIVWAREIPSISMQPLLDYFRQRDVWLVEPDQPRPELSPYPGPPGSEGSRQ
jgi:hypothetical protein